MSETGRIITGADCVSEGAGWLAAHDHRFARALTEVGTLPLRLKPDGFPALLDAITSQQVSVASATAIWNRLKEADLASEANVRAASDEDLRACGLSRPKVRYAKALAEATIDYEALRDQSNQAVSDTLIAVPGIGQWTVDIYLMFSLGRADVFASGDLALQEAARLLFGLDVRPSDKELRKMAQQWSPWQSVAARLLWAYYKLHKSREGLR